MADLASPISAFVREKANLGPGLTVRRDSMYADWRTWATDNGHQQGATSTFGRDLRSAFPGIGSAQPRDENGKQVWHHTGIGLKSVLGDD
jgi:putative DNA primase/helicase